MKDINELMFLSWCSKYYHYIHLRKLGLKKNAQKTLVSFFDDFNIQDKLTRREFIDSIHTIAFYSKEYSLYLPYNLVNEVMKPEIYKWMEEEPMDPIPLKWSYDIDLVKRSIVLDPSDQIALALYGGMIIGGIEMNQHEIDHGFMYDGDPTKDIELIDFYLGYINNIKDPKIKEDYTQRLTGLKECANKYS